MRGKMKFSDIDGIYTGDARQRPESTEKKIYEISSCSTRGFFKQVR